ncbi:MAG TPA: TIGR01906 family membrane protein [Promineifilum sp.]|nr:TIGR01906 family membrane protein [Promineifilum sp.]HRQ15337.1 TIGR01906 family membrane protein [Promineifilum sp.]
MENKALSTIIRWLVILTMPFFLGMGTIRAIIAWDYPAFEYQRIPPDIYGFAPEQRLALARGTLDYLQRSEPANEVIYMLEDLRLPGTDFSLYNANEISHMIDVKVIADAMKQVAYITGAIALGGLAILLIPGRTRHFGWRTLMFAGLATVIVLVVIGLAILVAWPIFFVQFHELLFPPGTWTFAYSDSLIRLFPEQFWFDFGVLISGATLVLGVVVTLIGYVMSRRTARA